MPLYFLFFLFLHQATAEQIRLAQMIYDKNDADFEDKVKQVMFIVWDIVWFKRKKIWIISPDVCSFLIDI